MVTLETISRVTLTAAVIVGSVIVVYSIGKSIYDYFKKK